MSLKNTVGEYLASEGGGGGESGEDNLIQANAFSHLTYPSPLPSTLKILHDARSLFFKSHLILSDDDDRFEGPLSPQGDDVVLQTSVATDKNNVVVEVWGEGGHLEPKSFRNRLGEAFNL